ncbi:hypothetical protein RJ639_015558 [Escallonia herrerae]|uniref:HAT C-terminal dimerisation domain-containing protein n=1 Tax=Escallonia herrerae TaxID=1293975 RepID=A0AA88VEQ9_9ASTE|nr:hypothetical protein RJ639_015558 [Escallonia herrerae]
MEETVSQGKPINKEQEETLKSKPSILAAIDELEKLRQPLSAAVAYETQLALERHTPTQNPPTPETLEKQADDDVIGDLLNLLYFGTMFDVKPVSDLEIYLEEGMYIYEVNSECQFDVIGRWKANNLKYKILSKLTVDVLSILITTDALEAAFSTSGKVIDPYRASLLTKSGSFDMWRRLDTFLIRSKGSLY